MKEYDDCLKQNKSHFGCYISNLTFVKTDKIKNLSKQHNNFFFLFISI